MKTLFSFTTRPESCSYLPAETSRQHYDIVSELTPEEYQQRLQSGWRRFGYSLFRPECPACRACQSIRVDVKQFEPDRSQQRAMKANRDLVISRGAPNVSEERIDLYDRFHEYRAETVGWRNHGRGDESNYIETFVANPFAVEEWQYRLEGKLVGVGYVDVVPDGLSAIYFFYDPDHHKRSLGTFNALSVIHSARQRTMPFTYLGYFVEGCRSLEYKARFRPNEVYDGVARVWKAFRS
jgi:arginyl-tRNA--protein-N-Asp/Glu arginylyltransferase